MTAASDDGQRQRILDQFTRQAVPFAEMHARDDNAIHQLLRETADVGPSDEVLDVACGPGLVACELARVARHVTGVDLTPAMIDQARERQGRGGFRNMAWVVGDAMPLPFPDATFSRVVTRYSFHHFSDPHAAITEMIRVCRPGGRVCVADVFTNSAEHAAAYDRLEKWRDPSHTHALQWSELQSLFAGLGDRKEAFYRYEVSVDEILSRSFPEPGGAEAFREAVAADVGVDNLGIEAHHRDGQLRFRFPVTILSGVKR
jgi:ubiquinone/menaquinone biosynthesis C-methylase UbiE